MTGAFYSLISGHDKPISERLNSSVYFKRVDKGFFKVSLPVCTEVLLHFFNLIRRYSGYIINEIVDHKCRIRTESCIILTDLPAVL